MIKTYHEAPKSIFRDVQQLTYGDYALANLLDDPEYFRLFDPKCRPKDRHVILDNGVFELGYAMDMFRFAEWISKVQPEYYVVPDALEDADKTIERFMEFHDNVFIQSDVSGKSIGVVQGKDYDDYVRCYQAIEPYCDKIGVSFDCSWYKDLVPTSMYARSDEAKMMYGRQTVLQRMYFDGVINTSKPHHLLGVALPQELKFYSRGGKIFDWIDSVDTSNPVVHGLSGIAYTAAGLSGKIKTKLYTLINTDVPKDSAKYTVIMHNIKMFREFCGYEDVD